MQHLCAEEEENKTAGEAVHFGMPSEGATLRFGHVRCRGVGGRLRQPVVPPGEPPSANLGTVVMSNAWRCDMFACGRACAPPVQALVPWFGMQPPELLRPLTTGGADAALATGSATAEQCTVLAETNCVSCKCHHGDAMKMASLFFALQTFAEGMGVSDPGSGSGQVAPLPSLPPQAVRSLDFDGVAIHFAQHGSGKALVAGVRRVTVSHPRGCACPARCCRSQRRLLHTVGQAVLASTTLDHSHMAHFCQSLTGAFVEMFADQLTGAVTSVGSPRSLLGDAAHEGASGCTPVACCAPAPSI